MPITQQAATDTKTSLHVLFGVFHIVCGIVGLAGASRLDEFGGDATPDLMSRNLSALQHKSAGGHYGPLPHLAIVEEGGSHTNKSTIANGAGVDGNIMAYGDITAYMSWSCIMGHMNARAILDIGAVADGDRSNVAANYSVEPNRTLVAQRYIAHQCGVLAKIAFLTPAWGLAFV